MPHADVFELVYRKSGCGDETSTGLIRVDQIAFLTEISVPCNVRWWCASIVLVGGYTLTLDCEQHVWAALAEVMRSLRG